MKKTTNKYVSDNRGAALISVVIAIMFIVILGGSLLYAALTGVQVKTSERKTDDTFYDTEEVMDEIRAGVAEALSKATETAYTTTFAAFAGDNLPVGKDAQTYLYENLLSELQALKVYNQYALVGNNGDTYSLPVLASFAGATDSENSVFFTKRGDDTVYISTPNGNTLTPVAPVINADDNTKSTTGSFTLKGVNVRYVSSSGYDSEIDTDIVINVPDFFARAIVGASSSTGYSLITDQTVEVSSGDTSVTGDVFVGGGITVSGGSLSMESGDASSCNVFSGGAIDVSGSGSFTYKGDELWASAININSAAGKTSDAEVSINTDYSNGNAYIAGDLAVNAPNSSVTIGGSYYGFGSSGITGSAVLINGKNTSLDLSTLLNLSLAGVAYVNAPNTSPTAQILTGQSMAVKSDQLAYLVPAECINNWSTNPYYSTETLETPNIDIDTDIFTVNGVKKKLSDYISASEIKTLHYPSADHSIHYVFMNFSSQSKANEYFRDYFAANPESIQTYLSNYVEAASKLSGDYSDSVSTKGNIYYTDSEQVGDNGANVKVLTGNSYSNGQYLSSSYTRNNKSPFSSVVNVGKVSSLKAGTYYYFRDAENNIVAGIVNGGTTDLCGDNVSQCKCFIAYNGSISSTSNVRKFNGALYCNNTSVPINNSESFTPISAADDIRIRTATCSNLNNATFGSYLNIGASGDGSGNSWDVDSLITYANWTKN